MFFLFSCLLVVVGLVAYGTYKVVKIRRLQTKQMDELMAGATPEYQAAEAEVDDFLSNYLTEDEV